MAKTLQSIINKVPPATINNPVFQVAGNSAEISDHAIGIDSKIKSEDRDASFLIPTMISRDYLLHIIGCQYGRESFKERMILLRYLRCHFHLRSLISSL